jgi:alkylated DNA nucleotide flippase Atl1
MLQEVEAVELEYRSVLATLYWKILSDLDDVAVVYEDSPSCTALASSLLTLLIDKGAKARAVRRSDLNHPLDHVFVAMGPYREGLGEEVLEVLRLVRRVAVVHTPAYYAAEEMAGFPEAIRRVEVRYAARELPDVVTYYRVVSREGELKKAVIGEERITGAKMDIIRRYEAEKMALSY